MISEPFVDDPDAVAGSARPPSRPLVFLSTLSAVDLEVLRGLCDVHPRVHLIHLLAERDPRRPSFLRRVRAHPWRSVRGRLRDLVSHPLEQRQERRIERLLFGAEGAPDPYALRLSGITRLAAWRVKDPALHAELAALDAERMIVCGAPCLPEPVYAAAAHGAFNVHFGIAPEYRGGNTIFWALYEGRRDMVGVTLHEMVKRIDAGRVVAQTHVAVEPTDDETSLWVRCAQEAALLVGRLAALPAQAVLEGWTQGQGGHLYRYADRTLWKEVVYAVRRGLRSRPGSFEARRRFPCLQAQPVLSPHPGPPAPRVVA